jgi:choline dehydrogenase-like flavoprotein
MTVPQGIITGADVTRDLSADCDVVIVGSGAGGATMAAELAEAGVDVVVIEEGGYHPTGSFRAETVRALRTLYRDGGGGMTIGRPSVLFAEGRCVGGSTVVNGGMSWRTPSQVLERWAAEEDVRDMGERAMEPYFAKAEARHSVGLQDPETIGRDSELLKVGAEARGWAVVSNRRNQLHCAGTNNCLSGCPTGAKRSMLVTSVPRALALGAQLFADCRVDRITRAGRAVTGVTGHLGGHRLTVRARRVIVAGGAIQTPALLARSGLRSASGQLGRNLSLHPNANVVAFFDSDVIGWHGVHQAFQVREFVSEGIVLTADNLPPPMLSALLPAYGRELGELMADYNHVVTAGPLITDSGAGRVRNIPGLGTQVFYRLTDVAAARLVRGVELTADALFEAGARRMLLPFDGAPEVRSPRELRNLLARPVPKASMQVYSIHLMGTARMSEDPRRGVTDSFGAVHGVPGLFVSDASLFPSPLGINPMETVIALAMRNARRIVETLLLPDGHRTGRHVHVAASALLGVRVVRQQGVVDAELVHHAGRDLVVGGIGSGDDAGIDERPVHVGELLREDDEPLGAADDHPADDHATGLVALGVDLGDAGTFGRGVPGQVVRVRAVGGLQPGHRRDDVLDRLQAGGALVQQAGGDADLVDAPAGGEGRLAHRPARGQPGAVLGHDGRPDVVERRAVVEALLRRVDLSVRVLGLDLVALDDRRRARLAPAVGRAGPGLGRVARVERLDDGDERRRGLGGRAGGPRAAARRRGPGVAARDQAGHGGEHGGPRQGATDHAVMVAGTRSAR